MKRVVKTWLECHYNISRVIPFWFQYYGKVNCLDVIGHDTPGTLLSWRSNLGLGVIWGSITGSLYWIAIMSCSASIIGPNVAQNVIAYTLTASQLSCIHTAVYPRSRFSFENPGILLGQTNRLQEYSWRERWKLVCSNFHILDSRQGLFCEDVV